MESNHIVCIAQITAKNDKSEELLEVLKQLIKPSRKEAGCLRYNLHRSIESPNLFTFVDVFSDQAAFDAHCESSYVKEAFDELIPSLSEEVTITINKVIV